MAPAITLTPAALEQLKKLKAESKGNELCLRIGVKSGGCSGMSYVMDFIEKNTVDAADSVIDHPDGFQIGAHATRPVLAPSLAVTTLAWLAQCATPSRCSTCSAWSSATARSSSAEAFSSRTRTQRGAPCVDALPAHG